MKIGDNYFGFGCIHEGKDNVTISVLNIFPIGLGMTFMHDENVYQIDIILFNKLKFGLNITIL